MLRGLIHENCCSCCGEVFLEEDDDLLKKNKGPSMESKQKDDQLEEKVMNDL